MPRTHLVAATFAALLAAASLLLAAVAAHAASPPWVGTWAASTLWCAPGHPGGVPPIHITPTGHRRGSNTCRYTRIRRKGPAAWRIDAACVDGWYRSHERFLFEMRHDNLAITYLDRGGAKVLEMRCP